jgi:hypothetical protein
VPAAQDGLLARLLAGIDQLNNPLDRATFKGDLAELLDETPVERQPLALLMLLAQVERAHGDMPSPI